MFMMRMLLIVCDRRLRQGRRTTQILGVLKFIMQSSDTSANICALLCYRIIYLVQANDTRKKTLDF